MLTHRRDSKELSRKQYLEECKSRRVWSLILTKLNGFSEHLWLSIKRKFALEKKAMSQD